MYTKNWRHIFSVIAAVILALSACRSSEHPAGEFTFQLKQHRFTEEGPMPLSTHSMEKQVCFQTVFAGSGGNYDTAQLDTAGRILRVVLINTDGKSEKMQVLYELQGSVSGLASGAYQLEVKDFAGKVIGKTSFWIQ